MDVCPTCQFNKPRATPDRGGRSEDYRAHAQHAHERADLLMSRESSMTQAGSVREHAFDLADESMAITAREIHGKGPE